MLTCVFSILKPGNYAALLSSYRPISLLDTNGKLFKTMLLTRILYEVSGHGLLRNEQFGFRSKHSTASQLTHFIERACRKFGDKWLTGVVFLNVAKILILYVQTKHPEFSLYLVNTVFSYLNCRTFKASFQTTTSTFHRMRGGVAEGGIISPILFSLVCE